MGLERSQLLHKSQWQNSDGLERSQFINGLERSQYIYCFWKKLIIRQFTMTNSDGLERSQFINSLERSDKLRWSWKKTTFLSELSRRQHENHGFQRNCCFQSENHRFLDENRISFWAFKETTSKKRKTTCLRR